MNSIQNQILILKLCYFLKIKYVFFYNHLKIMQKILKFDDIF